MGYSDQVPIKWSTSKCCEWHCVKPMLMQGDGWKWILSPTLNLEEDERAHSQSSESLMLLFRKRQRGFSCPIHVIHPLSVRNVRNQCIPLHEDMNPIRGWFCSSLKRDCLFAADRQPIVGSRVVNFNDFPAFFFNSDQLAKKMVIPWQSMFQFTEKDKGYFCFQCLLCSPKTHW